MTTGALIFAFNNEKTDYLSMAAWSAKNIRRHLNIPVAVVSNVAPEPNQFDQVILTNPESGGTRYFEDYDDTVTWNNAGRTDAYSLTPWDQTLVLDADYVVASNQLSTVLESTQDFLAYKTATGISTAILDGLNYYGQYKMPMWWATVMMFRRGNHAQYIFDCMQMIKNNWQHYRDLYGIERSTYRNDFALSIALGIVDGHTTKIDSLPGALVSVMPNDHLTCVGTDSYEVEYTTSAKQKRKVLLTGIDFHAMGKQDLEAIVEAN